MLLQELNQRKEELKLSQKKTKAKDSVSDGLANDIIQPSSFYEVIGTSTSVCVAETLREDVVC